MSLIWSPASPQEVYTEVSGTLTFTDDDVSAVYIDWDDGTSNKKEEANYQWWTTTEPFTSKTLTHTYTATGTYNPIVQVINDKGMASKYHSARDPVTTEVSPSVVDSNIGPITIQDGVATGILRTENRTVLSGIDNSIFEKSGSGDLYIALAPTLSLGSLNTIASGTGLKFTVTALVEDYIDSTVGLATKDKFTSVRDIAVKIPETTWDAAIGGLKVNDSNFLIKKVLKASMDTCKPVVSGATHSTNNDMNYLKAFFFTTGSSTEAGYIYPVTYLSFGCPVKKLDDADRYLLMDFTQSRAKASNTTISEYFFDVGKIWFNPQDIWAVNTFGSIFDYSDPSTFTSGTATTTTTKRVTYTYMPRPDGLISAATGAIGTPDRYQQALNLSTSVTGCSSWYMIDDVNSDRADQFLVDDFGRLADQYHLLRVEAEPNSSAANRSALEGFAGIYRLSPPPDWGASGAGQIPASSSQTAGSSQLSLSGGSAAKFYENVPVGAKSLFTSDSTSGSYINATAVGQASGTSAGTSGSGLYLSGTNVDMIDYATGATAGFNYTDVTGATRNAHEYLIALSSRKTNKIFINATPLAKSFTSFRGSLPTDSTQILGVYYLKVNNKGTFTQTCEWMPLDYEDTTKVEQEYMDTTSGTYVTRSASLAKSGYLSFEMPDDWSNISASGLTGGAGFGTDENPGDTPITSPIPVDANYEIELKRLGQAGTEQLFVSSTGSASDFGAGKYGKYVTITGQAIENAFSGTYTSDDIGAYKYLAIMISSSASNYITPSDVDAGLGVVYSGNQAGYAFWIASGASNGYDGGSAITLQVGQGQNSGATWSSGNLENYTYLLTGAGGPDAKFGPFMNYGMWKTQDHIHMKIRNVGAYDVFDGVSKVFVSLTGATYNKMYTTVDACDEAAWRNTYGFESVASDVLVAASGTWNDNEYYPLKIVLSGTDWTKFYHQTKFFSRGVEISDVSGAMQESGVELWNFLPADNAFSQIVKEVDDSAFNLSRLPLTSDVAYARAGNFYEAITRKGKVTVVKTGVGIQEIGFTSIALGDEGAADAFTEYGSEGTLYNYLHKVRRIEEESVPVFWDERQKDGTYVRFWGVVKNVNESQGMGGPRALKNFDFTMAVQKIALIDANGILIAGPLPLGGVKDERDFA